MRLAFSVAINVDADILLIDEILAVGDISFQTKCFEKLKEIKANGTTIVIVSHAMAQIEQICDRSIWIEEGLILEEGNARVIGQHYLASMEEKRLEKKEKEFKQDLEKKEKQAEQKEDPKSKAETKDGQKEKKEEKKKEKLPAFCDVQATRMGKRDAELTGLRILNAEGKDTIVFETGSTMKVIMNYRVKQEPMEIDCRLGISRDDGVHCYGNSSYEDSGEFVTLSGTGEICFSIEDLNLLPGKYYLDIGLRDKDRIACDVIAKVRAIQITSSSVKETGITTLKHKWQTD